jgi:hypothetical protein
VKSAWHDTACTADVQYLGLVVAVYFSASSCPPLKRATCSTHTQHGAAQENPQRMRQIYNILGCQKQLGSWCVMNVYPSFGYRHIYTRLAKPYRP